MSKRLYLTNVESRAPTSSDTGFVGNWWIDTSTTPATLYLYTASNTWTKQNVIKESAEMTMTDAITFISNNNILFGEFTILDSISLSTNIAVIDSSGATTRDSSTRTLVANDKFFAVHETFKLGANTMGRFIAGNFEIQYQSSFAIRETYNNQSGTDMKFYISSAMSLTDAKCKVKFYYI